MRFDLHITGSSLEELEATFKDLSIVADAVERWAVDFLRRREWAVGKLSEWETPKEFCNRVRCSHATFARRVSEPEAENLFVARRGPTGRIIELCSSPAFDAFCAEKRPTINRRHKK